jgi:methyl-accepting chemotaxis protein
VNSNSPKSTIGQRLILLVAVPLIALALCASMLLKDAYQLLKSAERTGQLLELSVAAGQLIHVLQIERGTTAGFVQSKGAKFADVLPGCQTNTDERLKALRSKMDGLSLATMPSLKASLDSANQQLNELADLRAKASGFSVPAAESIAYFTKAISVLVSTMDSVAEFNSNAAIGKQATAYQSLVRAKENAGQERGLSVPVFVTNIADAVQYRTILEKIDNQEAYLNVFRGLASEQERASLASVLDRSSAKEVVRLRGVMAERAIAGGFEVDPTYWFKTITEKIDALHLLENQVTQNILLATQRLLKDERQIFVSYAALTAIALSLTVFVAIWVGRGVSRPLNAAVSVAEFSVENNDFTRAVPEEGAAEVVRAAQAFNHIMHKFRKILSDASNSSMKIADVSLGLADLSAEVNQGASSSADSSAAVAAAVEEVSVSVSETATSAKAVSELVSKSGKETDLALVVMSRAVKNVDRITELIGQSTDRVEVLARSSEKIGGIIQVIKEIADQTNLLALNAAIEAARAGDQGRGFAVVADEVRKLAERTTVSTSEIAVLIDTIQSQIGAAVASMQSANQEAAQNKTLVADTEHAMRGIGEESHLVVSHVQNIADAIREQDMAIQQVAINLEKIAQMTEQSRAAAVANSDTASNLGSLANSLKTSVGQFKV